MREELSQVGEAVPGVFDCFSTTNGGSVGRGVCWGYELV